MKSHPPVWVVGVPQWFHSSQVLGDRLTQGRGAVFWKLTTDGLQSHNTDISGEIHRQQYMYITVSFSKSMYSVTAVSILINKCTRKQLKHNLDIEKYWILK